MNAAIVTRWNSVVKDDEEVYVLGDLMLNDNETAMELLKRLKGKIHIILGNHDSDTRVELYGELPNVVSIDYAARLNYKGYHFFLTHYPCFTGSLEQDSLKKTTLNLHGHTHSRDLFYNDIPFMYNVALDAHNCTPVSIDQIIEDCEAKCKECLAQL